MQELEVINPPSMSKILLDIPVGTRIVIAITGSMYQALYAARRRLRLKNAGDWEFEYGRLSETMAIKRIR